MKNRYINILRHFQSQPAGESYQYNISVDLRLKRNTVWQDLRELAMLGYVELIGEKPGQSGGPKRRWFRITDKGRDLIRN